MKSHEENLSFKEYPWNFKVYPWFSVRPLRRLPGAMRRHVFPRTLSAAEFRSPDGLGDRM